MRIHLQQLLFILAFFCITVTSSGQADNRKNTVYFNLSNPALFGPKATIFGYERTIGKHQSVSVSLGQMSLPRILNVGEVSFDSINVSRSAKDKGLHLSAEYRFYLPKENKHDAPHGLYIGPYYSYNSFKRTNTWTLETNTYTGDLITDFSFSFHTIGGELGYQFILWKRVSLDFILMGPGVSFYNMSVKMDTDLSADNESELIQRINDFLADKVPGYSLVIDDLEFQKTGSTKTTSFGFRYMVNIGFRF